METHLVWVIVTAALVIAALVGLGRFVLYQVRRREQKLPSESAEVRDVEERISAAQRRAAAAGERITGRRILAAQRRAAAAGERARAAAVRGARGKIFEFFVQHTTAWGSLWYFLVSVIGVNYSWGFYQQLDIHVFDFFSTPDFLLSAFQNIAMLIIGVLLTLVGLGLFFSLAYNSSIDSAHNFSGVPRVRREALILVAITLVSIVLLSIFVLLFSWWNWSADSIGPVLYSLIILILALLAYRPIKKLISDFVRRDRQETRIRPRAAALLFLTLAAILIPFFSWWQLPQVFPEAVLCLISVGIFLSLVFLTYRFIKLASAPVRSADRVRWDVRILLLMILAEATFIIPFLWGGVDSYAALEDTSRSVKVTFHRNAVQPEPRPPRADRLLFLGTTSSFHFFYGCGEPETGSDGKKDQEKENMECKNGRPFIVPTVSIASLDFVQDGKLPPHIVQAIARLDTIIAALKREIIEVISSIIQINKTIASINKNNDETNTDTEPIKKLKLRNTTDVTPDRIIAIAATFKAHLEDHTETPIAVLNKRISAFNSPEDQNHHCATGLKKVATIGPFPEGEHDRLEGTADKCIDQRKSTKENAAESTEECLDQLVTLERLFTPEQFVSEMNKSHQTLQHLMLIGRVDSSQFRKERRRFYGTQIRLARARAEWVRGELLKKFPVQIDPQQVTLQTARPQCTAPNASDCARTLDRSVEVWACWTPNESEQSAPRDSE